MLPVLGCSESHHLAEQDAAVTDAGLVRDATVTRDVGVMDTGPPPPDLEYDWGLGPLDSDTAECAPIVAQVYTEQGGDRTPFELLPGVVRDCWAFGVVVDPSLAPFVERAANTRCLRDGPGRVFCGLSFPFSSPVTDANYALYCDVDALFPSAEWWCRIYAE